jgi:hypothetical protein
MISRCTQKNKELQPQLIAAQSSTTPTPRPDCRGGCRQTVERAAAARAMRDNAHLLIPINSNDTLLHFLGVIQL